MGIAKFFAYISERYPALNEKIKENQIPEFDNLYLDMNGIIHTCTHPKDKDILFNMTEEEMFKSIFRYIEALFLMIKPRKLFFMAVDGVAPRAKINQQRSRRFCTGKTAEMLEAKAIAEGNPIPEDKKFDSNCITPGTLFMDKLNKYLKYFVTHNISTNKLWQKCKVIFSGSEVAGEGEHKIMDYIRYMKSQPDYDINTRHCLYGLDADLIMLGLCTHELHFALLREEIQFGKKQRVVLDPGQTQFYLFHISLMRDYIDHEFASLKKTLPFPYDVDKVIDDWILIAFLIGNDFIPHAPNIYILTDGIPILYDVYKQILCTFDGYINEGGTLNLKRFEKFMEKLSHLDIQRFSENYADLKFLESKMTRPVGGMSDREKSTKPEGAESNIEKPRNKELEALIKSTMLLAVGDPDEEDPEDFDDDDTEQYMMEFAQHKKDYYLNKLNYDSTNEEFLQSLTEDYIRAIQWNLYYYYEGCPSWTWFYPHHYAPYISDIKNFKHLNLEFEMGDPFLPFEQLLAVLPPYSRKLLPPAFQNLLVEDESPIISYYPVNFDTDLNGKRNDWEAVVLIPFINGEKLRDAMIPLYNKLTDDENGRNKHGPMCIFTHTTENLGIYKAPAYFPDVTNYAQMVLLDRKDIVVPKEKLVKGLSAGVERDILYLGFASLSHMEHTAVLKKAEVRVFNMPSRWDNMILQIPEKSTPGLEVIAPDLLGKAAYVNWPYLRRAKIIAVSDGTSKFSLLDTQASYSDKNLKKEWLKGVAATQWKFKAKRITDTYRETRGIEIGDTNIVLHACVSAGKKYTFQMHQESWCCEEQWYENALCYPYQVLVRDLKYLTEEEDAHKSVADVFSPGTTCFMLGQHHYGAMGEVLQDKSNERWKSADKIRLCLTIPPELSLKQIMNSDADSGQRYITGSAAAMLLGVSSSFFGRITGTIFVTEMNGEAEPRLIKHNIGFNLKFNKKNEEIPGYTRKINGQWFYTNKTVDLVRKYMKKYPELFERLWKVSWNDELCIFHADELFDKGSTQLSDVMAWLKENYHGVDKRACGAKALCPEIVQEIEKELDALAEKEGKETKRIRAYAKSWELFVPSLHMCGTMPDPNAKHRLFDRVINVREDSTIPLGYLGIIVAILKDEGALDTIYEIVFEKPFPGGLAINGCSNYRGYRLPGSAFINISHGERDIVLAATESRLEQNARRHPNYQRPQIHSDQSAFASVSVENLRLAPQTSLAPPHITRSFKNGNRENPPKEQTENDTVAQGKTTKPASEFQALWNELHEKQKSNKIPKIMPPQPGQKLKHPGKAFPQYPGPDPSAFLRAILKINDVSTPQNKSGPGGLPKGIPYLPPPANVPMNNRAPSLNSSSSTDDKAMDAPPLVKQMFHHARQTKESQNKDKKPPIWWYCSQLLNCYQLSRLGMPRYNYFVDGETNLIRAHIVLPDNRVFVGDPSMTHEQAAGSAAKKVYMEVMQPDLKNLVTPPHQWFANQNPPRGPPVRPPMSGMNPNLFSKPLPGPPPRFQHWHGKPPPTAPFPQMHIQRPQHRASQEDTQKPEVKNSTAFVPLQAQKKNRKLSASQTSKDTKSTGSDQPIKEAQQSKKESLSKNTKSESGEKEKTGNSIQSNSQQGQSGQNNQKAGRPKRSRVAAKFGVPAPQPAEPENAQST